MEEMSAQNGLKNMAKTHTMVTWLTLKGFGRKSRARVAKAKVKNPVLKARWRACVVHVDRLATSVPPTKIALSTCANVAV